MSKSSHSSNQPNSRQPQISGLKLKQQATTHKADRKFVSDSEDYNKVPPELSRARKAHDSSSSSSGSHPKGGTKTSSGPRSTSVAETKREKRRVDVKPAARNANPRYHTSGKLGHNSRQESPLAKRSRETSLLQTRKKETAGEGQSRSTQQTHSNSRTPTQILPGLLSKEKSNKTESGKRDSEMTGRLEKMRGLKAKDVESVMGKDEGSPPDGLRRVYPRDGMSFDDLVGWLVERLADGYSISGYEGRAGIPDAQDKDGGGGKTIEIYAEKPSDGTPQKQKNPSQADVPSNAPHSPRTDSQYKPVSDSDAVSRARSQSITGGINNAVHFPSPAPLAHLTISNLDSLSSTSRSTRYSNSIDALDLASISRYSHASSRTESTDYGLFYTRRGYSD